MKQACICRYCKKAFVAFSPKSCCRDCAPIEEEEFRHIEDYVMTHANCNAIQVAKALSMSTRDIIRYIDEGRLSISKTGNIEELRRK